MRRFGSYVALSVPTQWANTSSPEPQVQSQQAQEQVPRKA